MSKHHKPTYVCGFHDEAGDCEAKVEYRLDFENTFTGSSYACWDHLLQEEAIIVGLVKRVDLLKEYTSGAPETSVLVYRRNG